MSSHGLLSVAGPQARPQGRRAIFQATATASTPRGRWRRGPGKGRGGLVRWHWQLPRQRAGRVPLRDPQKRDVLPPLVCHARGGDLRRDRLHRVPLQPQAPPLDNRLQGAGRRDGRVLRALRERVVGAGGGVVGGINPGFFVSEILTQVRPPSCSARTGTTGRPLSPGLSTSTPVWGPPSQALWPRGSTVPSWMRRRGSLGADNYPGTYDAR